MLWVIVSWLVFGLITGLIARALYPGRQSMSLWSTVGLGIAGSFVGGFLANVVFGFPIAAIHAVGFIGSIIGAMLVLALFSFVGRRSARA